MWYLYNSIMKRFYNQRQPIGHKKYPSFSFFPTKIYFLFLSSVLRKKPAWIPKHRGQAILVRWKPRFKVHKRETKKTYIKRNYSRNRTLLLFGEKNVSAQSETHYDATTRILIFKNSHLYNLKVLCKIFTL